VQGTDQSQRIVQVGLNSAVLSKMINRAIITFSDITGPPYTVLGFVLEHPVMQFVLALAVCVTGLVDVSVSNFFV
jgi:hypothetical protein